MGTVGTALGLHDHDALAAERLYKVGDRALVAIEVGEFILAALED